MNNGMNQSIVVINNPDSDSIKLSQRSDTLSPKWNYSAPTPILIERGLTANVLQQELNTINNLPSDNSNNADDNESINKFFNSSLNLQRIFALVFITILIIICIILFSLKLTIPGTMIGVFAAFSITGFLIFFVVPVQDLN